MSVCYERRSAGSGRRELGGHDLENKAVCVAPANMSDEYKMCRLMI
jgi:hypothetical protein